jgi:hypothetical protein
MNSIYSTTKLNHNANAEADSLASQPWITADDLTGDIERLIGTLVNPYVDDSNPLMHRDELKAECRAKLARILHDGHLQRCPTRAKAFGFIKTSLRNHVMSLIQKYAFTEKRTGVKAPPRSQRQRSNYSNGDARELVVLSLDDEETSLQVGQLDPSFRQMEFFEELDQLLNHEERKALARLVEYRWTDHDGGVDHSSDDQIQETLDSIRLKALSLIV